MRGMGGVAPDVLKLSTGWRRTFSKDLIAAVYNDFVLSAGDEM